MEAATMAPLGGRLFIDEMVSWRHDVNSRDSSLKRDMPAQRAALYFPIIANCDERHGVLF